MVKISSEWVTGPEQGKSSGRIATYTFRLGYENKSVYAVSGTSRCLLSDKYKTHKYSVGRAYSFFFNY